MSAVFFVVVFLCKDNLAVAEPTKYPFGIEAPSVLKRKKFVSYEEGDE